MVIWKVELAITDMQTVSMPDGAKLLSVANQNGNLCLWAMVDQRPRNARRGILWPVRVQRDLTPRLHVLCRVGVKVLRRFVFCG